MKTVKKKKKYMSIICYANVLGDLQTGSGRNSSSAWQPFPSENNVHSLSLELDLNIFRSGT